MIKLKQDLKSGNNSHSYILVSDDLDYLRNNLTFIHKSMSEDVETLDFYEIFPGKRDVSIDDVRKLLHDVNLTKRGKIKFALINEADRLSTEAANALLKNLEEPPADTVFFLLTRDFSKILDTIISRSRVYKFNKTRDLEKKFDNEVQMMYEKNYIFLISFFVAIHGEIVDVKAFLNELKLDLYSKMKSESDKNYFEGRISNVEKCLKMINANVNSRLALENLMLEF